MILNLIQASEQSITIVENMTFNAEVLRSKLWYRGDADELFQFFHQLNSYSMKTSFWASVPTNQKEKIRKIHSGLPAIIADTLAYIVSSDLDSIDITNEERKAEWEELEESVDFNNIIKKSVVDTLVCGDGAFKISADDSVSPYPTVEFVSAEQVEYERSRGIITAIIFKSVYKVKSKSYELRERYLRGFVESKLFDESGKEVPLGTVPELDGIKPVQDLHGDYMMAVPLKFYSSQKHPGRGKSIFDGGKSDCFDALDEVISQWWDALRMGRVKQYIPQEMIPVDPESGSPISPNRFGNDYILTSNPIVEGVDNQKIDVVQPDIKYDAFVSTYTNCLLMCLQGLVSPATLGIDVGKMSSADAQREKKDVTGNTRNTITGELEKALPKLIEAILKTYDNMRERVPADCGDITVSFGEYGAPDFDSRVETVGKASSYGVMSVETQVEELWGSSKDEEWKKAEVARIKAEKSLPGEESAVGDELDI